MDTLTKHIARIKEASVVCVRNISIAYERAYSQNVHLLQTEMVINTNEKQRVIPDICDLTTVSFLCSLFVLLPLVSPPAASDQQVKRKRFKKAPQRPTPGAPQELTLYVLIPIIKNLLKSEFLLIIYFCSFNLI